MWFVAVVREWVLWCVWLASLVKCCVTLDTVISIYGIEMQIWWYHCCWHWDVFCDSRTCLLVRLAIVYCQPSGSSSPSERSHVQKVCVGPNWTTWPALYRQFQMVARSRDTDMLHSRRGGGGRVRPSSSISRKLKMKPGKCEYKNLFVSGRKTLKGS
jgi:hypothetical protein